MDNPKTFAELLWAVASFTHKGSRCYINVSLGESFILTKDNIYIPIEHLEGINVITNKDINTYLRSVKRKLL